ncbi:3-dehydroquinate synthase [Moraxella sp. Pampa]|uniref:3-dehydroquinate synthase n=1 Tax=Moraxella sp. Pampa TaxID=3111978 RepID=UPI002B413512|nr:3-dehydroquinate synthase [Moraxella sp. Pampa]
MITHDTIKHELIVHTQSHDYPIFIVASPRDLNGQFDLAGPIIPFIKGKQVLIVTNDVVAPFYLDGLKNSLKLANFTVLTCVLSDGEHHKNQDSINRIYDVLLEHHFSRDCTMIALGGGVIGDMVGFAAASFMRGVNFIQVPTTLLAQVDSSVGGKTGINHLRGKNMIGAFWQPVAVLADMTTFDTLPAREFFAGLAEVVKYALILDEEFLSWLECHADAINARDAKVLAKMVCRSCQFKADIVAADERESGLRALLNFGHTFGHIIETHQGYGVWLHGEAVSAGMMQALVMSHKLGLIERESVTRVARLLTQFHLPIRPPIIPIDQALDLMGHDKKVQSGKLRLVLLNGIGKGFVMADFDHQVLVDTLSSIDEYL